MIAAPACTQECLKCSDGADRNRRDPDECGRGSIGRRNPSDGPQFSSTSPATNGMYFFRVVAELEFRIPFCLDRQRLPFHRRSSFRTPIF